MCLNAIPLVKLFLFTSKTILRRSSKTSWLNIMQISNNKVEVKYKPTYKLQNKILDFFREHKSYKNNTVQVDSLENNNFSNTYLQDLEKSQHKTQTLISSLSSDELVKFIYKLGKYSQEQNIDYLNLIYKIDDECCLRIKTMTTGEVLKTIDAWIYCGAERLVSLNFYLLFMKQISTWLTENNLNRQELLQSLFYVALKKQFTQVNAVMKHGMKLFIENHNVAEMSVEELSILASVAFKTSTKVTSPQIISAVIHTLDTDLIHLLHEPAFFVSLVKLLRHAKHHDYNLLHKIAHVLTSCNSTRDNLNFTAKVHLLALYADALYFEEHLLYVLVKSCFTDFITLCESPTNLVINSYLSGRARLKDISRFLWAISYLGVNCDLNGSVKNFEKALLDRINVNEHRRNPGDLIDSVLSMWMIGFQSEPLLVNSTTRNIISRVKSKGSYRDTARLMLLLTCVSIEAPQLLNSYHTELLKEETYFQKTNATQISNKRPFLKTVYNSLKCLLPILELHNLQYYFYVPHLHISGLTMNNSSGSILHVEVLDPQVCLYNSSVPHGLMKLKLRLLEAIGNKVLLIDHRVIEEMDDTSSLFTFLEDQVNKLGGKS